MSIHVRKHTCKCVVDLKTDVPHSLDFTVANYPPQDPNTVIDPI